MFVPRKPFQPHLFSLSTGKAPTFPTNIRLRSEGLLDTNALAYLDHSVSDKVKIFITSEHGAKDIKLDLAVFHEWTK